MKYYLLLLVAFVTLNSVAQKKSESEIDHDGKHHGIESHDDWKKVKEADNLLLQHSYYNAIDIYKEVEKKIPDNHYLLHQLGNSYFIARDYANAELYFYKAVSLKDIDEKYPLDRFKYAETLKMNSKYDDAIIHFQAFIKSNRKDRTPEMKNWLKIASNEVNSCNFAKAVVEEDSSFHNVAFIDGDVNHAYTDFSPYPQGKDTLYFASLRQDTVLQYQKQANKYFPVKLYSSVREDTVWSEPEELPFNHKFEHTANGVYSTDKNKFYFTRCYQDRHNKVVCNIFYSDKDTVANTWGHGHKIGAKVNLMNYTSTQPTIQHYKKKRRRAYVEYDVIYFVSDRPGGEGGKDIWFTTYDGKKYSSPENCGRRINTIRDEGTPRYDEERNGLFLSSNYHWGLGGFDSFFSKGQEARFSKPENLGMPLNSSYDDTYLVQVPSMTDSLDYGYVVSNRPGGIALTSETCCDDIYDFQEYTPTYIKVKGKVLEQMAAISEKPVKTVSTTDSALVVVKDTSKKVSVVDSVLVTKKVPQEAVSDVRVGYVRNKYVKEVEEEGLEKSIENLMEHIHWVDSSDVNGEYEMQLLENKDYTLVAQKDGKEDVIMPLDEVLKANVAETNYDVEMKNVIPKVDSTEIKAKEKLAVESREKLTANTDVSSLEKDEKLVLDNMYFDSNQDKIKPSSKAALTLLLDFMIKHEGIKIEISGHTDSRGNDEYNMDLSQRRAESIMDYLIHNGIEESRVVAKGYGKTEPIAPNENKDGSDNPTGRKLNRRTEIKILANRKVK